MPSPASRISSFTITQPFLGAPLQFQPTLGSRQLEELIDAYVAGPASKQDKLSEVTIDFYNRATVDLSNGSLVRRYDVILPSRAIGQSPTQSQSSGFSPIYTPSPGSSATFGDSGNASSGMTPPSRSRHARGSRKPAKKETKKATEFRLPGFSIMTKDGVDVTNSAGRGTKTKEQREHAHMMRIMKACEECKRKKVRCDPSHKRSNNGSSAASTTTTTTKSSPTRQNPSPASTGPPTSREFAQGPSAGDFILFPENSSTWNQADISSEFDSQACDLSNFDFDISGIDINEFTTLNEDDAFEWSFTHPGFSDARYPSYNPVIGDRYGLGHWAEPEGSSPLNPANQAWEDARDSEQLGSSPFMRRCNVLNTSDRSQPMATNTLHWPDYFAESPELSFSSGSGSLEESLPTLSSSYAIPLDGTPGDSSGSQSSQIGASSVNASQHATGKVKQCCSKKRRHSQTVQPPVHEDLGSQFSGTAGRMESLEQLKPAGIQPLIRLDFTAASVPDSPNCTPLLLRLREYIDTTHTMDGLTRLPAGGLHLQQIGHADGSRQCNKTAPPETVGLILSGVILASFIAASLTNLSAVAQLGIQVFSVVIAAGTLWAGYDPFASATGTLCDRSPTPSIVTRMTVPPSSLLAIVASRLLLSTSSSRSLVQSSSKRTSLKRASRKLFPNAEASHWFGMLKRLSTGSSML